MRSSNNALILIKKFEGFRNKAYLCPAGVPTIGYGSTKVNGKPVVLGQTCSESEAEEYVWDELDSIDISMTKLIKVSMKQQQWDACADFCFNLGTGNFGSSTLLKLLNEGKYDESAREFFKWDKYKNPKSGLKESLPGLTKRRQAEAELFLS